MALKIRLRRMGATKQPSYRVVVAEARSPRDGRFVETLGHYNPLTESATIKIDRERLQFWLTKGARPTETVTKLLRRADAASSAAIAEPAAASEVPQAGSTEAGQNEAE
ncbi:MAG: 30S ribosomal protein S16 [Bacteroidetes bacterium]|nr:30S ribosomal protein S16 [Bacteroidota bacterium]MCL5025557.1 30S ribosomal protein S16 [Chloroflexota bacterium]